MIIHFPRPTRCLAVVLALATRQHGDLTFASFGNGSAEDLVGIIARGRERYGRNATSASTDARTARENAS